MVLSCRSHHLEMWEVGSYCLVSEGSVNEESCECIKSRCQCVYMGILCYCCVLGVKGKKPPTPVSSSHNQSNSSKLESPIGYLQAKLPQN